MCRGTAESRTCPAGCRSVGDVGLLTQGAALTLLAARCAQHPVRATGTQVALEVAAVRAAAAPLCPPAVVLERVVLTPSGNLLACWQVAGGADPAALRRRAPVPDPESTPACRRPERVAWRLPAALSWPAALRRP